MSTNEVSLQAAGAITIALIVGLGVFVYPWLLAQRYGGWVVGLMTILLGALFVGFERENSGSGSSTYALALAAAWALGPVIAGVIVRRIGAGADKEQ